jgi:hypothetical protein
MIGNRLGEGLVEHIDRGAVLKRCWVRKLSYPSPLVQALVPRENGWYMYHFCGTCTTETAHLGASTQPPNRDLHLAASFILCRMSWLAHFRRNSGHRARLRSERSISLPTTNIRDIFLQVLVEESICSSKGRVEGLCSGSAHLHHVENYSLVCASNGHEFRTNLVGLCRHDVRPVESVLCLSQYDIS